MPKPTTDICESKDCGRPVPPGEILCEQCGMKAQLGKYMVIVEQLKRVVKEQSFDRDIWDQNLAGGEPETALEKYLRAELMKIHKAVETILPETTTAKEKAS